MKNQKILISLLAVFCLVGCNSQPSGSSAKPADESNFVIEDFGTVKFEAEKFNSDNWTPDSTYGGAKVIQEAKASGGAYLAAGSPSSTGTCSFSIELKKNSIFTFSAAYAQTEDWLESDLEMDKTYIFGIENLSNLQFASGKNVLKARASDTSWTLMEYAPETLYAGTYKFTLKIAENTPKGCPSIDYISIKTKDADNPVVDPSTITEADIPDNDMRNLQQYKYVMEEDVYKYKTYATGADLSAPRGMKLRFADVEDGSKYYVQIAESEAALANAAVRETTESKVYTFHNAKLATKYYYRAATSEAGLANAKVYNITSTAQAPRVVYVPDVLNFRDIGGWESSLVSGAKINQGLYFRCAQLDAASGSTTSKLDMTKGVAALKELGIKCDIAHRSWVTG